MKQFVKTVFYVLITINGINLLANESQKVKRLWPDNLFAVDFVNNEFGVIAGYGGTVLTTHDGGKNWQANYIGKNELIRKVSFVDEDNGWAVGHRGDVFHTTDGGSHWAIQHHVDNIYLRDVAFIDKNIGWVVGHEANIWKTEDGGKHWTKQVLTGFTGRDTPRLHGIYIINKNTAITVGEFGVIAHTEDGGQHWVVTPVDNKITYLSVDGNNDSIYVVGLEGTIVGLTVATEDERLAIDESVKIKNKKKEAKARAKAKRKHRKYIPPEKGLTYRPAIEYVLSKYPGNTSEHLFDITVGKDGTALAVGRSVIVKIKNNKISAFKKSDGFSLDFSWLGGVSITPDGTFWAVGIRGLVVKGNVSQMTFKQVEQLGASTNIKLISSRWDTQK